MRTTKWILPIVSAAISVPAFHSCQDWGAWDPEAGNQQVTLAPVTPPPADYNNVSDPTIAEENGMYYIISTNAQLEGITYEKGLMVRSTNDLFNFNSLSDENAYVLSSVIEDWAGARILELDSSVDEEKIILGQPCLRKAGNEWRLYYSVSGGTNASVIGYATAESAAGPWTDKGEIISSSSSQSYKAFSPSFFTSISGSEHYLAFGDGISGIYIAELEPSGAVSGSSSLVAKNNLGLPVSGPVVFTNQNYYVLLFTMITGDNVSRTYQVTSTSPMSDYTDVNSRSAIFNDQWALTSILSDYKLFKAETSWLNVGSMDILWNGNGNSFSVNMSKANGMGDPVLQVRRCFEVMDARRVQSPEKPLMAVSPEIYKGPVNITLTNEDLVGDWHYGTQWAHVTNGMSDAMTFAADGTYSGGSSGKWDFNPGTGILHINSTSWNGEDAYLYCYAETDNVNDGICVVACGYNDTYDNYPGAWMKKDLPLGTVAVEKSREGIYAPSMAKENSLYYIFSGNAESDGFDYEKGLVLTTSDDLSFFDNAGFVLSDVVDGWAIAKLREIDTEIPEDAKFYIDNPCIRKVGNIWRLYYDVTTPDSKASVIGYAESSSLNGNWTDKGLILSSSETDPYRAIAPSFCAAPDNAGHYMAFGDNGIFITELNTSTGEVSGDPQLMVSTVITTGYPELFYANGTYNLFYSIFNTCFNQAAALEPMGPYYSYGNRGCVDILEWWTGRIFTPYSFESGIKWNGSYGGMSVYDDEGTILVTHQASVQDTESYEMHIRQMNWLDYVRPDEETVSWQKFPAISPERYTIGINQKVTREEIIAKPWNYITMWRVDAYGMNSCDAPFITFFEDGTHSLTGVNGDATWDYDENTGMLHFFSSAWGEHVYAYVTRENNFYNADGINVIVAAGLNQTFIDKTGIWMKQATE